MRLLQRRVAHPEPCAHVFREQFDGGTVGDGVGLRQVLHGFYQAALSVHVTRIGRAFTAFAPNLGIVNTLAIEKFTRCL